MAGVQKSKDGVPQWDGDSASFQEYEETALQWEQSIAYHKRYLAGPRLVAELSGSARKHVMGKRPEWLSYDGGVAHLLSHLRNCLGRPTIPELTEFLNRYFRQSRRRRFETMNQYITRKNEIYHRARQALSRVQSHYQRDRDPRPAWQGKHWWQPPHQTWWEGWQPETPSEAPVSEVEPGASEPAAVGSEPTGGPADDDDRWEHYVHHTSSHYQSWQWTSQPKASYGSGSTYDPSEDEPWKLHTDELLPEFLQGWYMLIDAGLDSTSRNMVQTALKEDYRVNRVSQELRQQWPDDDLKKFDQQNKGTAYLQDEVDAEDDEWPDAWATDDLTEEAQVLFGAAEKEAQEAYAMIQQGRRTLREARARQHQMRLNRQYYKNTFSKDKVYGNRSSSSSQSSSNVATCLRCGKQHRTSDCPIGRDKSEGQPQAQHAEEAPFVCFTEDPVACAAQTTQSLKSTREAVMSGYGVIDGGATRTLGSVTAIQSVMDLNQNKYGDHGITEVDVANKPTFGFGNSSQNQCISTAQLKIKANGKPGTLQIHALNQGQGPILISIDTLRKLKAVIDFSEDLMVLRALDDSKMIPLERSAAGHQLLPLTEDLMKHAMPCTRQVPSLRSFC